MPVGLNNPAVGLGVFVGLKLVGYSLFSWRANLAFETLHKDSSADQMVPKSPSLRNPVLIGAVRTSIGVVVGVVYVIIVGLLAVAIGGWVFLVGLVPFRLLEWYILFRMFYARYNEQPEFIGIWLWKGVAASFLIDIPAIVGLISTGAGWVC